MQDEQRERLLSDGHQEWQRVGQLSDSEALTIMIQFHQSQYRTFKAYYQEQVQVYLQVEFPQLVSYGRFVQRMPRLLGWLCLYLFRFINPNIPTYLNSKVNTGLPLGTERGTR
jgi:hypothetical protein